MKQFMKLEPVLASFIVIVLEVMFCPCWIIDTSTYILLDASTNGLGEADMSASVATLQSLASTLSADCAMIRERKMDYGYVCDFLVRKQANVKDFMEVRCICVCFLHFYFYRCGDDLVHLVSR